MELITGNKFKTISDYILDEKGFRKTDINNLIPVFFIKTDFIDVFFKQYKPSINYKIITHNSDYPISEKHLTYLNDDNLIKWYGQNINTIHPKLESIPIGIANEIWVHGNEEIIKNEISLKKIKNNLIYSNFDISTNPYERMKCSESMIKNGISISPRQNFKQYLNELNSSLFSISPNGNGIDCHKIWESLYLKTIPIVTKSINIDYYSDYPILIIDDWESFRKEDITIELYNKIIKKYDNSKLELNHFLEKILNT